MQVDLFPEDGSETERGVSPVIGVILMVAITVILAAVIGTFVLNLSGSVSQQASAGVSVDSGGGSTANVTVTSLGDKTDGIKCVGSGTGAGSTVTGVGETLECSKGNNIVAYSTQPDVENKTIKTDIGS